MAQVTHMTNDVRTLQYPRQMQGTTRHNDVSAEGIRDVSTLGHGDDRMYVKTIRRLKNYKELVDEVINVYITKYAGRAAGSQASVYHVHTNSASWMPTSTISGTKGQ